MLLYLLRKTVFCDPTKNCRINGNRNDWVGLPKSKSLFFVRPNCGLPIGNLTSQLFANIYLDELDQFAKNELKCRYYGRYVDDFFIIHRGKNFLKMAKPKIEQYIFSKLELNLHKKKIYLQHFSKGVRFLGAFIKPHRSYILNRTKGNFYHKIENWNKEITKKSAVMMDERVNKIVAVGNSYLGFLKHHKTKKLKRKIFASFSKNFEKYLYFEKDFIRKKTNLRGDGI